MAQAVKYTMGDNFVHVILPGVGAYALEASHQTFPAMKRALERKQWARVPHLINLAKQLGYQTHGKVTIERGIPYYKGVKMEGYLATKMQEMLRRGETKDLPSLLKFSNNLYQNPDPKTIPEILEFLEISNMPITDDGCFLAYKCIKSDYTDCHTGTVNNEPGETPAMPRKNVDKSTRVACSSGFHFAALDYIKGGFGSQGNRVVMIKINPRDVVAIPEYKNTLKGRTWFYEVVKELFTIESAQELQDHPEMVQVVVNVAKERNAILKFVLSHPRTKYQIRKGKIKKSTIVKQTLGRLQKMAAKLPNLEVVDYKPTTVLLKNPLKQFREAAGVELKDIAKELGMTPKAVWAAEHAPNPKQESIDNFLQAIQNLTGQHAGLSFPQPSKPYICRTMAASAAGDSTGVWYPNPAYNTVDEDEYGVDNGYGDEYGEDEDED
jgi:hypothetical protein